MASWLITTPLSVSAVCCTRLPTSVTGDMNPDGHEVVFELGVSLNADNSEAFGFHGCDIGLGGNNSVIQHVRGRCKDCFGNGCSRFGNIDQLHHDRRMVLLDSGSNLSSVVTARAVFGDIDL